MSGASPRMTWLGGLGFRPLFERGGLVTGRRLIAPVAAALALAAWLMPGVAGQAARAFSAGVRAVAPASPRVAAAGRVSARATLPDVSAGSPRGGWAVGDEARTLAGPTETVIDRWNGRFWAGPGSWDNFLIGVRAVSRDLAWAVGGYEVGRTSRSRTLILRWDGRTWSAVKSSSPGTAFSGLFDVTATTPADAWAVGFYQRSSAGPFRTLILHWNGARWARVISPNRSHGSDSLYGVYALSASDAWAVGNDCVARCGGTSGTLGPLILHWNGKAWSKVATQGIRQAGVFLDDVTATSPGNAWATGSSCRGPGTCLEFGPSRQVLILHWNGRAWSKVAAPSPGHFSELNGVAASAAANAWAAGEYCVTIRGCASIGKLRALILHWNGRKWSRVASPDPGRASVLGGLAIVSSADAWVSGYYCITATCSQSHTLILGWTGKRWSTVMTPSARA